LPRGLLTSFAFVTGVHSSRVSTANFTPGTLFLSSYVHYMQSCKWINQWKGGLKGGLVYLESLEWDVGLSSSALVRLSGSSDTRHLDSFAPSLPDGFPITLTISREFSCPWVYLCSLPFLLI